MRAVKLGLVLIGRNEGERFLRCLASIAPGWPVVYVDSGSTDGSVAAARAAGVEVVELDMTRPFTAARARNAGLERLCAIAEPEFVQFVDGDCEIREGWLDAGLAFLEAHARAAVVCGRNRERFPEASRYNRLCDREWDTPVGEVRACGGIAMMRRAALAESGAFDPELIAGEEPELCARLRRRGWQIWRIDAEMTWHDAAMLRFGQWWRRMRRGGFAAAQGAWMHGGRSQRDQARRALVWGGLLPVVILGGLIWTPWAGVLAMAWPLQVARLALRFARETSSPIVSGETWDWPFFITLGKFPEVLGVLSFGWHEIRGQRARIIEHK